MWIDILLSFLESYCCFFISFQCCLIFRWAAWCCMWRRPTSYQWSISPTPTVTSTWTTSKSLRRTRGRARIPSSLRNSFLSRCCSCLIGLKPAVSWTNSTCVCTNLMKYVSVVPVICLVKSTDLKLAWATKRRRAKKLISVSTFEIVIFSPQ